jgi:hypothetical protein
MLALNVSYTLKLLANARCFFVAAAAARGTGVVVAENPSPVVSAGADELSAGWLKIACAPLAAVADVGCPTVAYVAAVGVTCGLLNVRVGREARAETQKKQGIPF